MGCSSCQQNNHVVPTTHVHNTTSQTYCECACGCEEPVCPTPQPCTEITDSKCIIYTDAPIKCGNTTIVTTNASVSTALNQITTFFCNNLIPITEDIVCGTEVIVPANSTVEDAFAAVVAFACGITQDITAIDTSITTITGNINTINTEITALELCCDTNTETNNNQDVLIEALQDCCDTNTQNITNVQNQVNDLVLHYKYVHEDTTVFDGDVITITRQALEYCNLLPPACSIDPGFADKVCDLHVSVYFLFAGNWKKIPTKPYGILGTEGYELGIDATTGDLTITLSIAPIEPAVTVRVVILA
jgi:hypothetical protein